MRLFSTEQVSKYHPDKYADQISDAILDACLAEDPLSRVACECLVKGSTIILAGEITTKANINYAKTAAKVAKKLGYAPNRIMTYIDTQSPEIAGGVREGEDMGAGDQGMMYGYACRETESMLPFGFDLANKIIREIEKHIELYSETPFKGDAKCQVTVDLDEAPTMKSVKKILVSVCHHPGDFLLAQGTVRGILYDLGVPLNEVDVIINPAGEWTIGGPTADCGLTGRKIVCDQYGGYCAVGGGAFSGKDPSKVDRSGAYMARKIACDIIKYFDRYQAEVQIAYAIGQSKPMSVSIVTDIPERDHELSEWVGNHYDLTPAGIIKELDLLKPQYEKLAEGCHYRILN
jgi:S-adenosylmethionine synthetase